jgi:hypothetical protein
MRFHISTKSKNGNSHLLCDTKDVHHAMIIYRRDVKSFVHYYLNIKRGYLGKTQVCKKCLDKHFSSQKHL